MGTMGMDLFGEEESADRNLPRSLVPRLHCLFMRRVRRDAVDHPLLPPPPAPSSSATPLATRLAAAGLGAEAVRREVAAGLRSELVAHLAATALNGDALAAEYVLLNLLSRVRRTASDPASATARVPVGTVPLNLVVGDGDGSFGDADGAFAARLGAALAALTPACHVQPLDVVSLDVSSCESGKSGISTRALLISFTSCK
jgi:hypothetical protein